MQVKMQQLLRYSIAVSAITDYVLSVCTSIGVSCCYDNKQRQSEREWSLSNAL